MPCINTVVTNHFKMLFRDMPNQSFDKVENGNSFEDELIVFVTIVVKSNKVTVILVDTRSRNNRTAEIMTDVFQNGIRFTLVRFRINIESVFAFSVASGLNPFKRGIKMFLHKIKENGTEGISQKFVIKMSDKTICTGVAETDFRNQAVDMRIPFNISAKSMKNTDKTGGESSDLLI